MSRLQMCITRILSAFCEHGQLIKLVWPGREMLFCICLLPEKIGQANRACFEAHRMAF